jgi:hypothetical protein
MDSQPMDDRDVEDVELAERLQAYARARLSPSESATARMRAHVMAEAQRRARLAQVDSDPAVPVVAASPSRLRIIQGHRWRRPIAALLAASLTLALAVGSVAAAQPGGPLYGTRIWAESLTLPSSASDRAVAETHRLDQRLAEAATAGAAGDANAADAALAAYNGILAEAAAGTDGDSSANATLDTAVRHNIEVLTSLLARSSFPDEARDAIQHAIDQSDSAANGLQGEPGVGAQPSPNPGNGAGASNRPEPTLKPAKPTPRPTPKPHRTPPPHPTPEPAH